MKVQYTIIFVVFIFYGCSNKLNNSKIVDIEKSCKAGDKISCQKVADIFKKRNKPGDLSKAAKWYTEGCYLEYGKSCTQLGLLFEKDTVFEKDIKKSIRLYEKACDIGYAEACTRLGIKHLLYKARITGYCLDRSNSGSDSSNLMSVKIFDSPSFTTDFSNKKPSYVRTIVTS